MATLSSIIPPVNLSAASGTLSVSNGGTGVTTMTGYVKGSGTSALTASATIPTSDLSGTIPTSSLTGTLPVAKGGTGATTLSGYIKGNGTSSMTALTAIPTSDLTGTLGAANGGTGITSSGENGNVLTSSGGIWTSAPLPLSDPKYATLLKYGI